jgi:hypothetical protein
VSAELLPSTSAASLARKRLACVDHGLLESGAPCACGKTPYDLDSPDDRSILTSLRDVAKSSRMTRARIVCFPLALFGIAAVFGLGAVTFLLTPFVGEPLARALERVLRKMQLPALRKLDTELLP